MHTFYTPDIITDIYTLDEDESKHCIKVLRLKNGDNIQLLDGKGNIYFAQITDDNAKKCSVKIIEKSNQQKKAFKVIMAVAPTKNMDRMEWFVEKATEIGINIIIPIECKNSERSVIKTERLNKVAISAIKQSLNAYLPEISEIISFNELMNQYKNFEGQKFIAHCKPNETKHHLISQYKKNSDVLIVIGPEGDFTDEEINLALKTGFHQISLGQNRLRTETAALYACTAINLMNEN